MSLRYADSICPASYSGRYNSPGYGAHCQVVNVGPVRVWFSYSTPVAFTLAGSGLGCVVSENVWSVTTGRHLNEIEPNKKWRVPHAEFCRLWDLHVAPILEALDRLSAADIMGLYAARLLSEAAERQQSAA